MSIPFSVLKKLDLVLRTSPGDPDHPIYRSMTLFANNRQVFFKPYFDGEKQMVRISRTGPDADFLMSVEELQDISFEELRKKIFRQLSD